MASRERELPGFLFSRVFVFRFFCFVTRSLKNPRTYVLGSPLLASQTQLRIVVKNFPFVVALNSWGEWCSHEFRATTNGTDSN